jgi:hypothetical protein
MINALAVLAGGLFSVSFMAPKPYCFMTALASACLVMIARSL